MTEAAPLLQAVDLRSNIDSVYSQSSANACTAHAVVNALDCMYDNAGQSKRFSRAWVWWWSRVNSGRAGLNVGASFSNLKAALEQDGIATESAYPWTTDFSKAPPAELVGQTGVEFTVMRADINGIRRKLCLGIPVVFGMTVYQDMYSLYGKTNWREHKFKVGANDTYTDHAVCIVGYDDSVNRLLVENSWGPGFGDGGFFGIPYEDFGQLQRECWTVDRIYGFHPKPVENFVTIPYLLDANDNGFYTAKNKARLKQESAEALATGGVQGLIDWCVANWVTDKHLENLHGANRGLVRSFQEANPTLDWSKFPWMQL